MKHRLLTLAAAVLGIPLLLAGQAMANAAAPAPNIQASGDNFNAVAGIGGPQAYPELSVTAKQPIELPGKVLPSGKYTFRLIDFNNEVAVTSAKRTVGIFPVVPALRSHITGNAVVQTEESPAGGPNRISAWFFPGQSDGFQFIYPRAKHLRNLAKLR